MAIHFHEVKQSALEGAKQSVLPSLVIGVTFRRASPDGFSLVRQHNVDET